MPKKLTFMFSGIFWKSLTFLFLTTTSTSAFELTILHTNNAHARFEETNVNGGICSPQNRADGACFGGIARRAAKVKEIRNNKENVLLLDAGDQFFGTLWYYIHRGTATSHFMDLLRYDAMVSIYCILQCTNPGLLNNLITLS